MAINFKANAEERKLIGAIALRAVCEMKELDQETVEMDITAAHLNGCPLDLKRLLCASKLVLLHDVLGINRNISHETGALQNCFLPRFHAAEKKTREKKSCTK